MIDILQLVVSRYFEFKADEYSCELGYGRHLMQGLIKLHRENSYTIEPDPW